MQKLKRSKFVLVLIVMFSMLTMYGYTPNANAASLDSAKDTISDSSPAATGVTHTIVFNTGTDLSNGTVITVSFNASFGTEAMGASCPSDATAATSTDSITCTVNTGLSSTTDYTITATNVTNPGAGDYDVTISHNESGSNESTKMMVYIIDTVTVSASVDASLTFSIQGTATSTSINSESTTGSTTATLINFGTVTSGSQEIMGQKLVVATNAANGFSVTVQQNHNMQTAAAADIDSYSTTSPSAWASPTPNINDESTWGYMALTTDDTDVSFGASNYQGLDGTNPLTVMTSSSPADGENTPTQGRAYVAYSLEISSMQEAGDYQNTLTYICTPIF